jgi:hypothetical protein
MSLDFVKEHASSKTYFTKSKLQIFTFCSYLPTRIQDCHENNNLYGLNSDSITSDVIYVTVAGQPEYTNEDMEEELTEVRPLDIPLHLLELDTAEDLEHQRYATGTMLTFGQADFEEPTTITSRITELQLRQKLEDNMKAGSDWDRDDDLYDMRMEEADHSGDGSNLSPTGGSTTNQHKENEAATERDDDNAVDNNDESDDDDDDDDDDNDDDDDDDSDDEDGDEDNKDDDEYEDEDSTKLNHSVNAEDNRRVYGKKSKPQIKPSESTSKMSRNFEDSVEHGRQWKEDDSEGVSTPGARNRSEWPPLTTTNTPGTSRTALERDLATFLRNGSPEVEDPEVRNITKRVGKDKNDRITKKDEESDEAEFDTALKLQQIREVGKKAIIPQKVRYISYLQ